MYTVKGIVVLSFLLSGSANAQCINTATGIFCPPPGGSIFRDWAGTPVCGLGGCVKTAFGIECSNQPQGYAAKDTLGNAKCTGGRCVKAKKSLCQKL